MISGFDDRLIALIEAHPSIIVGTCDRGLLPTMARCFGMRVIDKGKAIEVLVSRWPGPKTLANIESTRRIAVTITAPESFDAYQIKGSVGHWAECGPEDLALAACYTEVISDRIRSLAEPEDVVRSVFRARGLYRVHVLPEAIFVQTPGKNAGQRL